MNHSQHSSNREKLLEHLFIGEVLRYLWMRGVTNAEFLRPEVDSGGYDLVVACNKIMRHVQLKSSYSRARTAQQKIHVNLAAKPSGCVVWMYFDEHTLELGPFLWFGERPGKPLQDLSSFPVAKHSKGNAQGVKAERPAIRVVRKGQFERVDTISQLVEKLFGRIG